MTRYAIPAYLFTLVRTFQSQHSKIDMSVITLVVFSAVFASGQPWVELSKLAKQRQDADDLHGAEASYREALHSAETQYGKDDTRLVPLLSSLAFVLHLEARNAEAEVAAQRAYSLAKESGNQKLTALMLNALGVMISGAGQKARAEPVLRRSLAMLEEAGGADTLDFARLANNLAVLYLDTQQFRKAEEIMARALPLYERYLGANDPELALASANMFTVLIAQRRAAEAEPYLRRALAIGEKVFPDSLRMASLQICLAAFEASRTNFQAAASTLKTVISTEERVLGPDNPEVGHALTAYAQVLRHLHQKSQAKSALNRANWILKSSLSDIK